MPICESGHRIQTRSVPLFESFSPSDILSNSSASAQWEATTIDTETQNDAAQGNELSVLEDVKASLGRSLQIGDKVGSFTAETRLLGELPELDSMAVLTVILGLEEHFGIEVEDDDISAETFETVGSVVEFVNAKLG